MSREVQKVFISWSKSPTDMLASELALFLRHMFDNVETFVSKDNVAFGVPSIQEIHKELAGTSFGILIVTKANQDEPWLNFEAGSLAKTIPDGDQARVVPLLIDHTSLAQLAGPIANFQALRANKTSIKRMVREFALLLDVDPAVVESRWRSGWIRLRDALKAAREELARGPQEPDRKPEDMMAEILGLLRRPVPLERTPERPASPLIRESEARSRRERIRYRRAIDALRNDPRVPDFTSVRAGERIMLTVDGDARDADLREAIRTTVGEIAPEFRVSVRGSEGSD